MRWLFTIFFCLVFLGSAWALEGPVRIQTGRPQAMLHSALNVQAAGPNDAVLTYDSGPVYYFPDATAIGSLWGVRFTPVQACSLLTVDVYAFSGGGQVKFHFLSDNAGEPGTPVATPQIHTLAGDLSKETVTLTPIDFGAGDFYVIMEIVAGPPPFPLTDSDGGTGRSWFQYPGQPWEHVVDFDIALRAGIRYYGPDYVGPEVVHIPVSVGFSEDFSTEIRAGLNDPSGIGSSWVYYRQQGMVAFDSTSLLFQFDNEYSAEIPAFPAPSNIEYFIRARDAAGTSNITTFPSGAPSNVFTYKQHPGKELKYDDGYPEMFFFLDTVYTGNAFAVRMTPTIYPAKVSLLRAYVSDTASFDFEIRTRVGDSVGGLLAGPFTTRATEPYTWVNFEIPGFSQPTITTGDFMMLFRWKSATPTSPAVGADSVGAADLRSYSFDGTYGWAKYTMFDWLMRAAVMTPTGVTELGGGERPRTFSLSQNVPNPFNPQTRIEFALSEATQVNLDVFNLLGQQVRTLVDEYMPAGQYETEFDGRGANGQSLPSGLYFYRLQAGTHHETRKMILMK